MLRNPKTPSRHRSRSDAAPKTPLTPSIISGLNNVNLGGGGGSPTKKKSSNPTPGTADITNPFIAPPSGLVKSRSRHNSHSRPASPVKRGSSGTVQPTAGVIRKGGVESRMQVVTHDYVPPPTRHEVKRSKSTPSVTRPAIDTKDRFITTTNRDGVTDIAAISHALESIALNPNTSPGHTARVLAATGLAPGKRILGFAEQPPTASSSDQTLAQQREFAKPLYAQRPGAVSTSTGATKTRKIPTLPERVLDAPGMVDDFYLNLLSWSCLNAVAVALESSTYIWKADTGSVTQLGEAPEGSYVSSVDFSNDGAFLGVGNGNGDVELWDVETGTKLRTMAGHQGQVAALSWHQHILSSGCGDGSIWHHDVRVPRHKVMELLGHTGEVCGLKWRSDGELLGSGGNDNVVNIWDGRLGDVPLGEGARGNAKWVKRNHTAAVKAIAWCPWQPSLLASGGGTNDATINVWNSTTGARLHTLRTPSQVTSIQWSPHRKELLSTHGYPTNSVMVHAYPSMERVAEIRDAHDSRVLFSAVGPAGDVVVTGAGDENLKFWRIWEVPSATADGTKKKRTNGITTELGGGKINSTKEGILSIR